MKLPTIAHRRQLIVLWVGVTCGCVQEDGALYINEFMASNAATIQDESGAFPDWVELYNSGGSAVSLAGCYLTDNLDVPTKAELDPSLVIDAYGYLLLWADGDTMEGIYHLPFSFDMDGEDLALYRFEADTLQQIDALSFGAQETDISSARSPDGAENWITSADPTPGSSNP